MIERPSRAHMAHACEALPIFPLPNVVLLPNTIMPLHVFEARYRALVRTSLAGNRLLAIPSLADGWEDDDSGRPPVHPVAGLGLIVQHQCLPDGRYNIALLGVGRVLILDEHPLCDGYRVVQAQLLDDILSSSPADSLGTLSARLEQIRLLLAQLLMLYPRLKSELAHFLEVRTPSLALLDALAHLLLQEAAERQHYLEEDRPMVRADRVLEGLAGVIARASSHVPEA